MRRRLFWWEAGGFAAVAVLGTLLHFTYDWSGEVGRSGVVFRRQRVHLGTYEAAVFPDVSVVGRSGVLLGAELPQLSGGAGAARPWQGWR